MRTSIASTGPTPSMAPPNSWASEFIFHPQQQTGLTDLISTRNFTTLDTAGGIHPDTYSRTVPDSIQSYFDALADRPELTQMNSSISHKNRLRTIAKKLTQEAWKGLEVKRVRSTLDCMNEDGDLIPEGYRVTVSMSRDPWGGT